MTSLTESELAAAYSIGARRRWMVDEAGLKRRDVHTCGPTCRWHRRDVRRAA